MNHFDAIAATAATTDEWAAKRNAWREQRRERERLADALLDLAYEWDVVPELTALIEISPR